MAGRMVRCGLAPQREGSQIYCTPCRVCITMAAEPRKGSGFESGLRVRCHTDP